MDNAYYEIVDWLCACLDSNVSPPGVFMRYVGQQLGIITSADLLQVMPTFNSQLFVSVAVSRSLQFRLIRLGEMIKKLRSAIGFAETK